MKINPLLPVDIGEDELVVKQNCDLLHFVTGGKLNILLVCHTNKNGNRIVS